MQKMKRPGFTLVEVLIVVIMIGVLAALIIPRVLSAPEKAKLAEAYYRIGVLNRAQLNYMASTGSPTIAAFTCVSPPGTCSNGDSAIIASLTALGLRDFPQKDFKYGCFQPPGVAYCTAHRWLWEDWAGTPRVCQYFIDNINIPSIANKWYCVDGANGTSYVTVDGNRPNNFSDQGCKPNW